MNSANATMEMLRCIGLRPGTEWVNDIRLPVLKGLCVDILSNENAEVGADGKALVLEEKYAVKEIGLDELAWTKFCSYDPDHVFYAQGIQPLKDMDPICGHYHVYWDGSIVLFSRQWRFSHGETTRYARPKRGKAASPLKVKNDMVIRVYLIKACEHDYEVTRSQMCYREYKCRKCGHEYSEDSSD